LICRPAGNFANIAKRIIEDLKDRRGLRQAWESIDADIQKEIEEEWQSIAMNEILYGDGKPDEDD
jgi:hypothetical protein